MVIDIIGAGIGGLTTAIALEQKGFKTRIFEQAEKIKPVGAGIILANNAMQVYKKLDLNDTIKNNGNPISSLNITTPNLKLLSKVDLNYFEQKYEVKNIAIHRGILQQILIDQLKSSEIILNHKLKSVIKNGNELALSFENGKNYKSSTLIGADGINSVVRQQLFPKNKIRHANQSCWRGISDYNLPPDLRNELNEAWGKEGRFGFVQISEDKVYWYALKSFMKNKDELTFNNVKEAFYKFHPTIKDIICSTSMQHINKAEISDLKPTKIWYNKNVCLIGDAAHATTPNMGQGACQAIEDAFILSECLSKYEVNKAFNEFQKIRLPKAHQVVKISWIIGKIAHYSSPFLIKLRNTILRLTPSSVNKKQNESIFKLGNI
ncbi:FAD-dependent monooxygenase [Flavivirga jejuensis]|uniref:FAD-dependent monooxygenase n=1 Tax=Flavivirga jejuensis TaxID=870487 RepID=A0ABT8WPT5_9FLAO|nr:FAD-dependent monooxygenase [Flavivirga jejuensis]MDO5975164.1 FAD-dependent monooxygenase [Flavivirga jejuensis]